MEAGRISCARARARVTTHAVIHPPRLHTTTTLPSFRLLHPRWKLCAARRDSTAAQSHGTSHTRAHGHTCTRTPRVERIDASHKVYHSDNSTARQIITGAVANVNDEITDTNRSLPDLSGERERKEGPGRDQGARAQGEYRHVRA